MTQESGQSESEQSAKAEFDQKDDSQGSESAVNAENAASNLAKQFEETAKKLKSDFDEATKKAQSNKDKQFANQQKVITQLQESVVALANKLNGGAASEIVSRGNAEREDSASYVKDIFATALDLEVSAVENTPEYLEFIKENGADFKGVDGVAKASKFLVSKVKGKTQVSDAARAQAAGGGVKRDDNPDLTEYIQNYTAAVQSGDGGLASRLRSEARKKGLPIDSIQWNVR